MNIENEIILQNKNSKYVFQVQINKYVYLYAYILLLKSVFNISFKIKENIFFLTFLA